MSLNGLTFSSMTLWPSLIRLLCSVCRRFCCAGGFVLHKSAASKSQPIGGAGHDASGVPHQRRQRWGQFTRTGGSGCLCVGSLIGLHLRDDLAATLISRGQPIEMTGQVALHLPFGFGNEAQAQLV